HNIGDLADPIECDVGNTTVTFVQPAADGTATGLAADLDVNVYFAADGSNNKTYLPASYPILNWTVAVTPDVTEIHANAIGNGTLYNGFCSGAYINKDIAATILWPEIEVTKVANTTISKAGDSILYTITVQNNTVNSGPVGTLTLVSIDDSLMGNLTSFFSPTLAQGASESHDFDYEVKPGDPDSLENIVTVTYNDVSDFAVSDTASATVNLVHPSIEVTKTADKAICDVGDTVEFCVTVENTGDVELILDTFTDDLMGNISPNFSATLASGADETYCYDYVTTTIGLLTNTAVAHYDVANLPNDITDDGYAEVDVLLRGGDLMIFKYKDSDGDGTEGYQPGEGDHGLGGWNFTVEGPGAYSWSGDTASDGYIILSGLEVGTYTVTETLKLGWTNTDPGGVAPYSKTAAVPEGGSTTVMFGNWAPTACLEIFKFEDANSDGTWDPGEEGLPNWHFVITDSFGVAVDEGYTDADGLLVIEDLLPDIYTATETPKVNWHNTTPLEQTVTVEPGPCARLDFGNRENLRDLPPMVPTMGQWGIIALVSLLALSLTWTVLRRRRAHEQA
ncbi:MAG: SpaA isopeptide-forming pilin-related protein, partial [Chloroflexota bacterium]|nr:SpaA isopeptide-forming pilin-related protein [Chloroflexota bacterium]